MRDRPHAVHHGTTQWGQQNSEDIILRQHHVVDGAARIVETTICYKVPQNTQCWLSINMDDIPFITTKAVVYADDDLLKVKYRNYNFRLPPNDKNASHIIVPEECVIRFERHAM